MNKAVCNSKQVTQKVTFTYVSEVANRSTSDAKDLLDGFDATGSLALHRLSISNTDCSMGVCIIIVYLFVLF
jgi:hypothetical protein